MRATLAMLAAGLLCAGGARAVTQEDFLLKDGEDLVDLCTVGVDDPLYVAAIHLCHGFAVGTYRTIGAMTRHKELEPLFCPPNPVPTRNEGIAAFVSWAQKNPEHRGDAPEQYLGRFLIVSFPCPHDAAAGASPVSR